MEFILVPAIRRERKLLAETLEQRLRISVQDRDG
jgi:hypothetical protein